MNLRNENEKSEMNWQEGIKMERTPREVVVLYKEVADAVMEQIPADIFGKSRILTAEDYRTIVASCMIAYNDQFKFKKGGTGGGGQRNYSGQGNNYNGNASDKQMVLIAELKESIPNKEGAAAVEQFLDANGKTGIDQLTKSEASSLIDCLLPLAPKKRR